MLTADIKNVYSRLKRPFRDLAQKIEIALSRADLRNYFETQKMVITRSFHRLT